MPKDDALANVTRALVLGAALGLPACAVPSGKTSESAEMQLCQQVITKRDTAALDRLLAEYPNGKCLPMLVSALPPSFLATLSPQVRAKLRRSAEARRVTASFDRSADDRDSRY